MGRIGEVFVSRNKKLLVLAGTLWPVVYIFLFMAFVFVMILTTPTGENPGPPPAFFAIFVVHFLTILSVFGMLVYYMVHALRNERLEGDRKLLWALLLFFGNMIIMPVYWYLQIWKAPEPAPPASRDGPPASS